MGPHQRDPNHTRVRHKLSIRNPRTYKCKEAQGNETPSYLQCWRNVYCASQLLPSYTPSGLQTGGLGKGKGPDAWARRPPGSPGHASWGTNRHSAPGPPYQPDDAAMERGLAPARQGTASAPQGGGQPKRASRQEEDAEGRSPRTSHRVKPTAMTCCCQSAGPIAIRGDPYHKKAVLTLSLAFPWPRRALPQPIGFPCKQGDIPSTALLPAKTARDRISESLRRLVVAGHLHYPPGTCRGEGETANQD